MKNILLLLLISIFYISGFSQSSLGDSSNWDTVSIQENNPNNEPRIFPNPCKQDKVNIEFSTQEITEIKLTNIAGKEVFQKKFKYTENKKQIQLTEIPNGIYLMRIKTNDEKIVVKKLLVAKN